MNMVVIGAAKGLGLCLTRLLLENGHKVAAGTVEKTAELAALAGQYDGSLMVFDADVTNETQIQTAAADAAAFLGPIDALCNAAGVLLPEDRVRLLHECDIGELRTTLDVNTIGPVIVVKHFYPHIKKGGSVFTVTSEGTGIKSCGTWVPCYGLSKAAATKVSGILNASVEDVDFYSVHPGRMNTDMGRTTAQIEPEDSAAGFLKLMDGGTELSRENWYIDYLGNQMEA